MISARIGFFASPFDADALAYIKLVETADTQTLENSVRIAINDFIVGCKLDGIWPAIKSSCILMGARTLAGALTPLVGTAPTNFNNNFVSGDYNRKTGLVGNGTNKSLDSGRDNNVDPQNSFHLSAYVSSWLAGGSIVGTDYVIGDVFGTGWSAIAQNSTGVFFSARAQTARSLSTTSPSASFVGVARASSTQITSRVNGITTTTSIHAQTITQRRLRVFASSAGSGGGPAEFGTQRIAFYSIGESLTLSALDSRVTTLYNAIGAAIP